MEHGGRAFVTLTPQALKEMFKLPEEVQIVGAEWDFQHNCLKLYLRGEIFPSVMDGQTSICLLEGEYA